MNTILFIAVLFWLILAAYGVFWVCILSAPVLLLGLKKVGTFDRTPEKRYRITNK